MSNAGRSTFMWITGVAFAGAAGITYQFVPGVALMLSIVAFGFILHSAVYALVAAVRGESII